MNRYFSARAKLFRASTPLLLVTALASAGCDWREFEEYEETAPIRVHDAPSGRLPYYGQVLTSFSMGNQSAIVASSGPNTPVVFQRMWTGSRLSDEAIVRCKGKGDCDEAEGLGETLIPFPVWAHATPQERTGCILSPGVPKAFVFCDSHTNNNQSWDLSVQPESDHTPRFSGVGLPASHGLGIAILGVYDLRDRGQVPSAGRLYYQPDFQPEGEVSAEDEVPPLQLLPLRDPVSGELFQDDDPGDLGFAVAAAPNASGELVIAISQPSRERVIIATYRDDEPGEVADKLHTRACLESPDPGLTGFGKRLLVGDINDDGAPEIFAGIDPSDPEHRAGGASALYMYRGAWLPQLSEAESECPEFAGEPDVVRCGPLSSPDADGILCEGSGFGAALALGDVDGDGVNDVLVGAPYADVQGSREAGAVWIIPGHRRENPDPLDFARSTVVYGSGAAGAHLGMTVAALRTRDRDEPVAGAPGEARLYTFMCSGLESDVSAERLCLPQ